MKIMFTKKAAMFVLAGCLIFGMTGCGGARTGADSSAAESGSGAGTGADSSAAESGSGAGAGADSSTADAADFDAVAYVEMLVTGDASTLETDYAYEQELLDALEPMGGFEGLKTQLQALGDFGGCGTPIVTESQGYTSYSVPCEFSVQNVNIQVSVDAQNRIAGIFTLEYTTGETAEGETLASLPSGLKEVDVKIPVEGTQGWELPGVLTLPEGEGPFPAVILVHGSGPNDMDETIGPNKPFRDLAWGLADKGIAVLRYDKRTYVYASQMSTDTDLTLKEETVDDAVSAAELLAGRDEIDHARIYVLGHSLGGEALPRIAEALKDRSISPAGFIFMAAPARPASVLMREQLDFLFSFYDSSNRMPDDIQEEMEQSYAQLDLLDQIDEQPDDAVIFGAYAYYWKDLEHYDPVAAANDITADCLVLQGEQDYQVSMDDFSLWKDAYDGRENWSFISYPGLMHLFMPGERSEGSAAYMTEKTVDDTVIADIAAFVKND